ncbi:hypothetical protein HanXRQr2_Chr10g0421431 [Helianthus annuus]|uniref:Uncharacterized protein n=1 Tax=Helianthus annuus TaxID=4232 RepID=A0A9K3HUY0_HELAN|nr:hypothetical protein HanXRQr2_Chr10g0421431 [Helianthus annuus]
MILQRLEKYTFNIWCTLYSFPFICCYNSIYYLTIMLSLTLQATVEFFGASKQGSVVRWKDRVAISG